MLSQAASYVANLRNLLSASVRWIPKTSEPNASFPAFPRSRVYFPLGQVVLVVQRAKVGQIVFSAFVLGLDVVYMPPIVRSLSGVVSKVDGRSTTIAMLRNDTKAVVPHFAGFLACKRNAVDISVGIVLHMLLL